MKMKYSTLIALAVIMVATNSCSNKLDENPHTVFTVDYFKTPNGLQSAVYALYSGLRFDYGPEGAVGITCDGTDEWTYADQPRTGAAGTGDYLTLGNYSIDAANGGILTPWNRNYSNINLANAVINFAPGVSMDAAIKNSLLAEAHFMRGLYYLLLVQQFGAVPIDLGSGDLQFNQNAFQGFNRLPVADILAKDYQTMIDDFTYASLNLPDARPATSFKLSKAAAFFMLARTYTYRGYSTAKQPTDFQSAYTAATEVINNQAKYGVALLPDYADVHRPNNDYNQELIFAIERIPGDLVDNENISGAIGAGKGNDAVNDFNPDYTSITIYSPTASFRPNGSGGPLGNGRTLDYGRPLRRFCPTKWLFDTAFADKYNDSRYHNSFRTVWKASAASAAFGINIGDTSIYLADTKTAADSLIALGKKYKVFPPDSLYVIGGTTRINIFPNLKKYDDPKRSSPNDQGGRPFVVAKLSELYLLAAEAAMQNGDPATAATLINILRTRAAFRPGIADLAARVAAMQIASAQITLDFILDERTRELAGESVRWPDLAVRGKLIERVKAHNPDAAPKIAAHHVLRPIPQTQLNAVSDADKAKYQNPGY